MSSKLSVLVFLSLPLAACTADTEGCDDDGPVEIGSVVDSVNQHTLDLFAAAQTEPDNQFMSGLSVQSVLGPVLAGAEGQTEAELLEVLHVASDEASYHAELGGLLRLLDVCERDHAYTLDIGNRLWVRQGESWDQAYLDLLLEAYGSELQELDFSGDPEGARGTINAWVSALTADKIPELMPPGSIDGNSKAVWTNAIYMNADWATEFDASWTSSAPFTLASGDAVQADLMVAIDHPARFALLDDGTKVLVLPYIEENLAMVALLPPEHDGLPALEAALDANTLAAWVGEARNGSVHVTIPRFTMRWKDDIADTLDALGLPSLFGDADLSGMGPGGSGIAMAEVWHEAFVDVHEAGTEAAAATGGDAEDSAGPEPDVFRADHPFLFLLQDEATGAVLFMGRVADPTAG